MSDEETRRDGLLTKMFYSGQSASADEKEAARTTTTRGRATAAADFFGDYPCSTQYWIFANVCQP